MVSGDIPSILTFKCLTYIVIELVAESTLKLISNTRSKIFGSPIFANKYLITRGCQIGTMTTRMLAKIGYPKILHLVSLLSFGVEFAMRPIMVNMRHSNVRIGGISPLTSN